MLLVPLMGASAAADQNDPRLGGLFERLQVVANADEASFIEAEIWQIWLDVADPEAGKLLQTGLNAMHRGDYGAALAFFDDLVTTAPFYAEGWNKRATTHFMLGNYTESLKDIAQTLALEPRHFGALSGRGLVNLKLQKWEAALAAFEDALAVSPRMASAHMHVEMLRRFLRKNEI
ncbi:MAG: tetratricopeptide repeat protein [Magnetospiraceae bacterium]